MGINVNGLRFLLLARSSGVDFSQTAMIGRQGVHLKEPDLRRVFAEFELDIDNATAKTLLSTKFAEPLFEYLGARSVSSYDNSDYEGATYVCDFNNRISSEHYSRYTCVIDGGSLEHIFNIPIALMNCLSMVNSAGHFMTIAPCNNYMGHGFYQFSPEFYWRALDSGSGYEIKGMWLVEGRSDNAWYSVPDPREIGCRVGVTNVVPSLLHVLARKTGAMVQLNSAPQQADYAVAWRSGVPMPIAQGRIPLARRVVSYLSEHMRYTLKALTARALYPSHFKRIKPALITCRSAGEK